MSELVIGTRLDSYTDFDRLPVGTVIGEVGGSNTFTKQVDGWLCENSGTLYSISDFSLGGYNEVRSLPKDAPKWESLAQWQFRYRDNAFASAENAGVNRRTVLDVMRELGIDDAQFPLGRGVKVTNEYDKGRLPDDTQAVVGQPDRLTGFGLFVKRGGMWTHLLGEVRDPEGARVEVVTGEEVAWATTPGTEAEQAALRNFKAKAWRVGWKVKRLNRWCESYEQYMRRVGLTEDALNSVTDGGVTVGERIDPTLASGLPEGSLLRWHRKDGQAFTWYVRDNRRHNDARTRAIFGHRRDGSPLRNYARTMEVMWIANEERHMSLRVDNLADIFEHLPVGTRFRVSDTQYVLCHDRKVTGYNGSGRVPDTGPWTFDQLGSNVTVAGFPS